MERKDPYDCLCTVTVTLGDKGEPADEEGTCSGILIDSRKGLVLTHASVLYPLAAKIRKDKFHSLRHSGIAQGNLFSDKSQTKILFPSQSLQDDKKDVNEGPNRDKKGNYNPAILNCNFEDEIKIVSCDAKLKCVFECKSLKRTVQRIMPSDSWQFLDSIPSQTSNDKSKSSDEEELYYKLIPCFVLFKLKHWQPMESDLMIKDGLSNHLGDPVEICATPFGGLNPEVFLNSRARGIISNMAGPKNVLILTDARCVPGSEGGGLFYCNGKQRVLTGIIVASLCWKNNEWVGLTMACAISELLGNLDGILLSSPDLCDANLLQSYALGTKDFGTTAYEPRPLTAHSDIASGAGGQIFDSVISRCVSLVPLVRVGNTWGSGVLLDPGQGIILTCSHVLKGSDHIPVTVRLKHEDHFMTLEGQLVYKSPDTQQFDLGVVKIASHDKDVVKNKDAFSLADVREGEIVYVIGHALFAADLKLQPTVTMGIVSKVNRVAGIPVMIQKVNNKDTDQTMWMHRLVCTFTTCAVHAGASGGAVINQQGKLVAIIVCNSKDVLSGALYPHVNMCVPIATIVLVLKQYLLTGDSSVLKALNIKSESVRQLWCIGSPATSNMLPVNKL